MSVAVTCHQCGQRFAAAEHLYGRSVPCPMCQSTLVIPRPDAQQPFDPSDSLGATPDGVGLGQAGAQRFRGQPAMPSRTVGRSSDNRLVLLCSIVGGATVVMLLGAILVSRLFLSGGEETTTTQNPTGNLDSSGALTNDHSIASDGGASLPSDSSNGAASQLSERQREVWALLPYDVSEVCLKGPSVSARVQQLTLKFQRASQANPSWFMNYVKEHSVPGQPLPWHPNFGITQDEYVEMQAGMQEMQIVAIGKAPIECTPIRDHAVRIRANGQIAALDGIEIDVESGTLVTPVGTATGFVPMSTRRGKLGPLDGYEWKLGQGDPTSGDATFLSLVVARSTDNESRILYYQAKKTTRGRMIVNADVIIEY